LTRGLNDNSSLARDLIHFGYSSQDAGNAAEAGAAFSEAIQVATRSNDLPSLGRAQLGQAFHLLMQKREQEAEQMFAVGHETMSKAGPSVLVDWLIGVHDLLAVCLESGRTEQARILARRILELEARLDKADLTARVREMLNQARELVG
jgi:hypothetical protein